jgi:hypothetical protein
MFWSIVIGFMIGFGVIIFVGEFFALKFRKTMFGNWWRKNVIEDSDEIINHK